MLGKKLFVGGKKMFVGAVILVTFVTSPVSWAGIVHEFTPDEQYLAFGNQFESVGFVEGFDSNGVGRTRATGVLVAPNIVATSAHVVTSSSVIGGSFGFGLGSNFISDRGFTQSFSQASSNVLVHPDYQSIGFGPDLALIVYDNPFPATPAKLFTGQHELGNDYAMVGYGRTGNPGDNMLTLDGYKRGGINSLSDFGISFFTEGDYIGTRFVDANHPDFNPLGMLGAPGDSGGGWFINIEDEWLLAGLTSRADSAKIYNDRTHAAITNNDWLSSSIEASAIPEPSSFAVFGLGFIGVIFFAHRKKRRQEM